MGEIHECEPVIVACGDGRPVRAGDEFVALEVVVLAGGDATVVVELVAADAVEALGLRWLTQQAWVPILRLGGDGQGGAGRVCYGRIVGGVDTVGMGAVAVANGVAVDGACMDCIGYTVGFAILKRCPGVLRMCFPGGEVGRDLD